MSTPDDLYGPTNHPTPAAGMFAVTPLTVEQRMGLLEGRMSTLETRLDTMHIRVDEGDAKRDAIAADVATLKTDVTDIKAEMGTQTTTLDKHTTTLDELKAASTERTATLNRIETLLKPFGSVFANPRVQAALVGLVLAAILALSGWLTSKGHIAP